MIRNSHKAALAAMVLVIAGSASAQDRSPGLLESLFNRGEPSQSGQDPQAPQSSASDVAVRLDRLENRLRQLTGQIEQLQFRNQQLEQEVVRLGGSPAGAPPPRAGAPMTSPQPGVAPQGAPSQALPPPSTSGKRSDVFDPTQHQNAPGAPRALGTAGAAPVPVQQEFAVGAPGGRGAGEPLDLSGMSRAPTQTANADPNAALPAPPPRNVSRTGGQVATLPPSRSPKDEYDLAYGYVLHKDYALAEKAFSDFLKKNPDNAELTPAAHYWLGESYFQRQKYQDAADSYLVVVRNYEKSDKAPDSLLRLGQVLAALGKKEMACASLGEVNRKYPRASAGVKRGVAAEQKRVHC